MTNDTALLNPLSAIHIRAALAELGYHCAIFWHVDDVKTLRPDLTDEQCQEVLEACEHGHDASVGLNWDDIRTHAQDLFPESVS